MELPMVSDATTILVPQFHDGIKLFSKLRMNKKKMKKRKNNSNDNLWPGFEIVEATYGILLHLHYNL